MTTFTTLRAAAVAAVAILGLSACAGADAQPDPSAVPTDASAAVTVTDAWVKAADAEAHMTSGFALLDNTSATEVNLVSATSPAADAVELHEMSMSAGTMSMREVEGGFVLPAGERFLLEPGGFHLMLMGLHGDVLAGDEIELTLAFSDESSLTITAVAKDFTGANEEYEGGHGTGHDDHGDR